MRGTGCRGQFAGERCLSHAFTRKKSLHRPENREEFCVKNTRNQLRWWSASKPSNVWGVAAEITLEVIAISGAKAVQAK